jgi:Na+/glutamate symporter
MKAKRRFYVMFVGIIILNMLVVFHSRLVLYEAQPAVGQVAKQQSGK